MATRAPDAPEARERQRLWKPRSTVQKVREAIIEFSLLCCGLLSIAITLAIASVVIYGSVEFFLDPEYQRSVEEAQQSQARLLELGYTEEQIAEFKQLRKQEISPERIELIRRMAKQPTTAKEIEALIRHLEPDRERVSAWYFFTGTEWSAGFSSAKYGVLPLVAGTLLVAIIAALIALPLGLTTAIYLSEYATPRVRAVAKPTLEILAGIPTVVYGFFAVTVVTPFLAHYIPGLDDPYNQLSGGIVVGIMILPIVASLSEDALRAVPRSLRDASLALGANKYETSTRVVVPAALSGIIASFILAISRAIGETMAVSLACGDRPKLSLDPREGIATMTSFIVRIAKGDVQHGSTDFNSLFAVAAMLFFMTLMMNIVAQWVLRRYRQVYQ